MGDSDRPETSIVIAACYGAGTIAACIESLERASARRRHEIIVVDTLDHWIGLVDGLVTFGRQGLFAHGNTHHTMAMAYALVASLRDDGSLDREAWARARRSFEDHVVED